MRVSAGEQLSCYGAGRDLQFVTVGAAAGLPT